MYAPQREVDQQLGLALAARGLKAEGCGIRCLRSLYAAAPARPADLEHVLAAAERSAFIARHGGVEHALTLSGCSWAALQDGRRALHDAHLLAVEERTERAALQDFVRKAGGLQAALSQPDVPQGMHNEIRLCYEDMQQGLAQLTLS